MAGRGPLAASPQDTLALREGNPTMAAKADNAGDDSIVVANGRACQGMLMISSFMGRGKGALSCLAQIAGFLPDKGPECQKAMQIVTDQRKFLTNQFVHLGGFVGTFYGLEENILHELKLCYEVGNGAAPIRMQKRNMMGTLQNLKMLGKTRQKCIDMMDTIEQNAIQMREDRNNYKLAENVLMDQLATFGGRELLHSMLEEHQKASEKVTKAETKIRSLVEKLHETEADIPKHSARIAVMDCIQRGEKDRMARMAAHAQKLEDDEKVQSERAGRAVNHHHRRTFLGITVYEYKDNAGDTEKARAAALRKYAQEASRDTENQQEKFQKAAAAKAEAEGGLKKATLQKEDFLKQLDDAKEEYTQAVEELKKVEATAAEERERFGGLSLQAISALRHHLQELPELILPKAAQDNAMFGQLRGFLLAQEALMNRMHCFIEDCKTDEEALMGLQALRPVLLDVIDRARFYQGGLGPLQEKIQKDMEQNRFLPVQGPSPAPALEDLEAAAKKRKTDPQPMVSLAEPEPW